MREEFRSILRFWLDRGLAGFRVDVAHGLVKLAGLPDYAPAWGRRPRPGPAALGSDVAVWMLG